MTKKILLASLSSEELIARYVELCLFREQAERFRRTAEENRFITAIWAVEAELKSRSGDQRSELIRLFDNSNRQVRVQAACTVSRFAPTIARPILELIVKEGLAPYSYQARERLMYLDDPFPVPS
jgi:DICT domain-containing protein